MKKIRLWLCKHLGWHKAKDSHWDITGFQLLGKCKYCNKEVIKDSQGNWF